MRAVLVTLLLVCTLNAGELTISGTRFLLDGKRFPLTGISFFNAIYNPTFNKTSADRRSWMQKFQRYGINMLRIWAQWDSKRGFADACPECSLYFSDGRLRPDHVTRLKEIVADADALGMVIELALFANESVEAGNNIGQQAPADKALAVLTAEMKPHRNLIFQVWNERSDRVLDHVKTIKSVDGKRIVTNSPGFSSDLGDQRQNTVLDFLSPHTARQRVDRHWEVAPAEIAYLLKRYNKPVVDDEPARNGTPNFGGPKEQTYPSDQILQISQVWQLGGYIVYHHDMFQTGYGTPAVPPSGIPDPEFSPYHRAVLEFIARRERYMPKR
jgi:hypothetical protein